MITDSTNVRQKCVDTLAHIEFAPIISGSNNDAPGWKPWTDGAAHEQLVKRLAIAKASDVASRLDQGWVIGSDQVCTIDGNILGKPGTHEQAVSQLRQLSGHAVTFFTGLCLHDSLTGQQQSIVEPFTVHFRTLDEVTIQNYLQREQPYDCAGSFKSEGMGIGLNLCRSIVESHQGRLHAENLYNGSEVTGCRFSFWLPLATGVETTTLTTTSEPIKRTIA